MKWQCPHHKMLQYFNPGRCLICQTVLEPVPTLPKLVETIISDKELLKTSLDLANNVIKALVRR